MSYFDRITGGTPTTLICTEVLLTTSAAALPRTTGRRSCEIQNNGPNSILVGPDSTHLFRLIVSGASWTVDYDGPIWGKVLIANQITGAATCLSEIK
jgi:hypothetical protein